MNNGFKHNRLDEGSENRVHDVKEAVEAVRLFNKTNS
jgi:hypothetical protein